MRRVSVIAFFLIACSRNLPSFDCPPGATDCYGTCDVTVISDSTLPAPLSNGSFPDAFCPSACRTACASICGADACSPGDAGPRSVNCTRRCLYK